MIKINKTTKKNSNWIGIVILFILLSPIIALLLLLAYAWLNTSGKERWCKNISFENKEWMLVGNYHHYDCMNKNINKITVFNKNNYPIHAYYYYEFPLEGELQQEADTIAAEHMVKKDVVLAPHSEVSWKFFNNIELYMRFTGYDTKSGKGLYTEKFTYYLHNSKNDTASNNDEICISRSRADDEMCLKLKDACQVKLVLNGDNIEERDLFWKMETVACSQEK